MTDSPAIAPVDTTGGEFVAQLLPATAPQPEAPRKVSFLKALLLFWLFPRWYGPHLASGSLRRALAAHAVSVLAVTAIAGFWTLFSLVAESEAAWTVESVRLVLAEELYYLIRDTTMAGGSWWAPVLILGAIPLLQVVVLLAATAVMPWCAGGDRASSVWRRSVKNAYWCTTALIPVSIIVAVAVSNNWTWIKNDLAVILLGLLVMAIVPAIPCRMLVTGAARYVGQPDGPAFAPREPTCDDCGYTLFSLAVQGRCPECGLAVRDSLPGGRRRLTAWQESELSRRGFVDLLRMQWVVIRDPALFNRLPVQSGLSTARHFWWGTYLLMVVSVLALLNVAYYALPRQILWSFNIAQLAVVVVIVPFVLQGAVMFAACLWAQFRAGIRDYRVSATVCYYAAPLLWPLMLTLTMIGIAVTEPAWSWLDDLIIYTSPSARYLTLGAALAAALGMLAVACLWFWVRRLSSALLAVRYSNV